MFHLIAGSPHSYPPIYINDFICFFLQACSSTLKSKCIAEVDGYYIESVICVIIGLIWVYTWGKPTINKLQSKSDRQWKVQSSESNRKEH